MKVENRTATSVLKTAKSKRCTQGGKVRSDSVFAGDHYWRVKACIFDEKTRRYYYLDECNGCDMTNASWSPESSPISELIVPYYPAPHYLGADIEDDDEY